MTGLYVHVPFCRKKCHYCNFVIALSGDGSRHASFLNMLEQEAKHYAPQLQGTVFETVYIGGGTPSTLETDELQWLMHILHEHFRWKPEAEVTCEVNPGDVDLRKAIALKRLGFNRVSFGAQSFHDRTLERMNRTHRAAEIANSFKFLRDAGFRNINIDLMLSLPGETWNEARYSLEQTVRMGPEHISLYELTVEERTVFGDLKKKGTLGLPTEEEQFSVLSNARVALQEAGFRHYELLNYAKPGSESRHNLLYWANEQYLGLGPGAYSYIGGCRYRNSRDYEHYMSKTAMGDWRPAEAENLSEEKRENEAFLLALRLTEGTSLDRFPNMAVQLADELADLEEKGFLDREGTWVRLSSKGQFFAETVFSELSKP